MRIHWNEAAASKVWKLLIKNKYVLAVLLVGMFVAFTTSIIVIKCLMNYIKRHDFKVFGAYRILLGIVVIAYFVICKSPAALF